MESKPQDKPPRRVEIETLTARKAGLYRLVERFGIEDANRLAGVLAKAGLWPKGRRMPNADHVAALTIAATIGGPRTSAAETVARIKALPLRRICVYGGDRSGQIGELTLPLDDSNGISMLISRNMATVGDAVRYLLAQLVADDRAPGSGVSSVLFGSEGSAPNAQVWLRVKGQPVRIAYGERADDALVTRFGCVTGTALERMANQAQPFLKDFPAKVWTAGDADRSMARVIAPTSAAMN